MGTGMAFKKQGLPDPPPLLILAWPWSAAAGFSQVGPLVVGCLFEGVCVSMCFHGAVLWPVLYKSDYGPLWPCSI